MEDQRKKRPESKADLPGKHTSLWTDTTPGTDFPKLGHDLHVDVAIVGGGIAGLTTAMLLQEAGLKVVVVEARGIVTGVTANTTAKITALHGAIYKSLITAFGREGAQIYAQANQAAIDKIERFIDNEGIDCDFSRDFACTYTASDALVSLLEEEVRAAESAGLPVYFTENTPLPYPVRGAICLKDQARFHPRKYLLGMVLKFIGAGGSIFENTRCRSIRKGKTFSEVVTDGGILRANDVVIATNYPFYDPAFYFSRLYPYRSYALGIRLNTPCPEGMYISVEEPFLSARKNPVEGGEILIVGGVHHKTGMAEDTVSLYKELERFARRSFDVKSIDYHWSTQDNSTPDHVPYIGPASPIHKNLYIITGFKGWGMAHSMVAAMIISDAVLGRKNDWASLYNPLRFKPSSALKFAKENMQVAKSFVKERLLSASDSLDAQGLRPGEGGVFQGKDAKIAVAKDSRGETHAVSPVCVHLGCMVSWNNGEETWDCPCHGSRFDADGHVIHAPANRDLEKKTI